MESEKYLEGQSMQRPPLFESDGFIYWKNRFETYVKSKDLDLWHVITDGDFPPIQNNPETKKDEIVPFHKQNDDLKKKLAKNNEAKMGLENKILVPKPPRNCARCARYGTPVDGPYCHGCALLRKKFKENLFTYCVENEFFEDLQDISESSDDNTNVVNAPQEPFVEISSGSTTTRSDYSLLDYEAFYSDDDHIKEKNSGSTTTHVDFSKYDSFIFDLSINPFPVTAR
ncbi:hypothetical protein Tco_0138020 [Tanacetum coccineum]